MNDRLASLPDLLIEGGDERLDLSPAGINRYGHGPYPRPDDLAFGSSTASTISAPAFSALEEEYDRIAGLVGRLGASRAHQLEAQAVREAIGERLGGFPSTNIALAASGTDVHLIAVALLARREKPLLSITLSEHETGSGVGAAIAGRHFAARTPNGQATCKGQSLFRKVMEQAIIETRLADGQVRDRSCIAAELEQTIGAAIRAGKHCVLVVTDVSKSGLLVPDPVTVAGLKMRFGDGLDILIDACQLRLGTPAIRAYLAHGYWVAITGSKFLGGPVFCGALLSPTGHDLQRRTPEVDTAIDNYIHPVWWPSPPAYPASMRSNLGLILRWRAALFEWTELQSVPVGRLETSARAFALAMKRHFDASPGLTAEPITEIDRRGLTQSLSGYDRIPTIFPFRLSRESETAGQYLSVGECRNLWTALATPTPDRPAIRLGQPIAIGHDVAGPIGALRLCLSARQLRDASLGQNAMVALVNSATTAIDETIAQARRMGGALAQQKGSGAPRRKNQPALRQRQT